MTYSTGLWDRLFGKRAELGGPVPDGTTRRVSVTEAWLDKAVAEGKITPSDQVGPAAIERANRIQGACHAAFEQARHRVPHLLAGGTSHSVVFWLADFPQALFDTVFALDGTGQSYVPVLVHAETEDGAACAVLTQAYSLWLLQQVLANSSTFRDKMGFDMPEVERIVAAALPGTVLGALDSYRRRFDLETLEVDPRDWPIVWLWDVTDSLIHNKDTLKKAMGRWNADLLARTAFASSMAHLTVALKQQILEQLGASGDH